MGELLHGICEHKLLVVYLLQVQDEQQQRQQENKCV